MKRDALPAGYARVETRKRIYIALIAALFAAIALFVYPPHGVRGLLVVALVLLIPGRLATLGLRDLFRGRRLTQEGRYEEAIEATERFLDTLSRQPWRRWLIYAHYGVYTWSAAAMARNNLGVARMLLGQLDAAEAELLAAETLDPGYAIPIFNRGLIALAREREEEGERLLAEARVKGYANSATDRLVIQIAAAYARTVL